MSQKQRLIALICTYNGEKYILEQINSIINQILPVDYIYIYDFKSSDNTVSKINAFIESNGINNIFIQNEEFTGSAAKSFIIALKKISDVIEDNDLLFICDQDDIWLNDKTDKIFSIQTSANVATLIHHDVYIVDAKKNILKNSYYTKSHQRLISKNNHRYIFSTCIGHTIAMNFKAVNLLKNLEFSEAIIMHDWFWSIIIGHSGKVIFVDSPLSLYRQHGNNLVGANVNKRSYFEKIKNFFILSQKTSQQISYFEKISNYNIQKFIILKIIIISKNFKMIFSGFLTLYYYYINSIKSIK